MKTNASIAIVLSAGLCFSGCAMHNPSLQNCGFRVTGNTSAAMNQPPMLVVYEDVNKNIGRLVVLMEETPSPSEGTSESQAWRHITYHFILFPNIGETKELQNTSFSAVGPIGSGKPVGSLLAAKVTSDGRLVTVDQQDVGGTYFAYVWKPASYSAGMVAAVENPELYLNGAATSKDGVVLTGDVVSNDLTLSIQSGGLRKRFKYDPIAEHWNELSATVQK